MVRNTSIASLCLMMLMVGAIKAQQKKIFSLQDFVDSARRNLPLLMEKQALVSASKAGVADARHSFLPNAFVGDQVNLGTDNALPGSYLSLGIIPSTSNGIHSANDYQSASGNIAVFQSQYELLDFGLKRARVNNAQAYVDLSQADLEKEDYQLKWQVGKLYFSILKNQFQLGIDLENMKRYESIYTVIKALTGSGIKPGADSSLALAELAKSRITYNQTMGQIRQLLQQLSYLSGVPADRIVIDTLQTKNYFSSVSGLSMNGYSDSTHNPLTEYYDKEKALYLQTEDLVKKSYLPKVLLTGSAWARGSSIDYTGEFKTLSYGLGYQRYNYMVGATFVYDLFNGVHRKDKASISHYNTVASDYHLQQEQLALRNINNEAEEAIQTSEKNLFEIPVQIKAAEDTYSQKTAQYKAGIINLIDLTNASFVLYRSQSDYVQTLSDWLLANLDKAASTGNLDLFIQTVKK